jgi:gentisate 1,2-dioxygenase
MSSAEELNEAIGLGNVTFAREEIDRRRTAPVHVSGDKVRARIAASKEQRGILHLIDPKLGFNNRAIRLWINFPGSGEEAWEGWNQLGHRHLIDAVIHIVQGHGYSIIDGVRYDWGPGDFMCVPTFAWHRHVNIEDEPVIYIASTSTPYSMSLGVSIHEDERYPEYWIFAQKGEEAQKTLIPGAAEAPALPGSQSVADFRGDLSYEGQLYEEQVAFASEEERRRRMGRVLVKASEVRCGWTRMGKVAYIVDQRLGFNVRVMSTLLAEIDPGHRSGAHRHLYEEVNYILAGEGYSIIDDRTYEWKAGDSLCIPVFAWHQHFNTGSEPARILAHTSRAAMENVGLQVTQQGESAD